MAAMLTLFASTLRFDGHSFSLLRESVENAERYQFFDIRTSIKCEELAFVACDVFVNMNIVRTHLELGHLGHIDRKCACHVHLLTFTMFR
jgi:hypothetical protein